MGTKVLCAKTSCIPEICEDAVAYFDPYDYEVNLKKLLETVDESKMKRVLDKYSWEKAAKILKKTIIG